MKLVIMADANQNPKEVTTPRCLVMMNEAMINRLVGREAQPAINDELEEVLADETLQSAILDNDGKIKPPVMAYYGKTVELENILLKGQAKTMQAANKRRREETATVRRQHRTAVERSARSDLEAKAWKAAIKERLGRNEASTITTAYTEKLAEFENERNEDNGSNEE